MITDWDLFVASIDRHSLELERFGLPALDEMPGAPADRRMRAEHRVRVAAFRYARDNPATPDVEITAAIAESRAYDRQNTYKQSPQSWAALRQRREHRAAQAAEQYTNRKAS